MRILNQTRQTVLADQATLSNTPITAMIGLLKHQSLSVGEGMVIVPTRSIHMFFMKFAIDVIFIDRKNVVVGLVKNIKPFRISPYFWRAHAAIELPSGLIDQSKTAIGDHINF